MKKFYLIIYLFNFCSIILSLSSSDYSLIFPFNIIYLNELENISLYNDSISNSIMRNIFENNIFIKLKLGTPSQDIKLPININSDDFFIVKEDANFDTYNPKRNKIFYFDKSLSSTFEYQNDKEEIYYSHPHISNYVQDNFIFHSTNNKDYNIEKFKFLLANQVRGFEHGVIGLKGYCHIPKKNDFLTSLKNYDLSNNYIWYLKYNDSSKGDLIIGNYPHEDEYNKQNCNDCLFQKKYFSKIYSNISKYNWENIWGLYFERILIKNKYNYEEILIDCENCKMIELNPNLGIIKGSQKYQILIENSIFNKYINQKLCFKDSLIINKNYDEKIYEYYYCNISIINELKNEFKTILFEKKHFNTNFSLNYDDLFEIKNEFIFFKIIFDDYYNWIFGSPFFNKYLLIFNSENKEIGFYSKNIKQHLDENENDIDENDKEKNDYLIFIIIGIIFLGILLIAIGIFIGKKLYGNKREKRINELEDNFEI